jgi:enoyl-CoA hydratase/3-hydroxyacyl-CoA dehydrogenase
MTPMIKDMDTGAKVGLRWRRGPFELMNGVGIEKSHQLVQKLLGTYPRVSVPPVLTAQREKGVPWSVA